MAEESKELPSAHDIELDVPGSVSDGQPVFTPEEIQEMLTPENDDETPEVREIPSEEQDGFAVSADETPAPAEGDPNGFSIINDLTAFDILDESAGSTDTPVSEAEQSFSELLNQFTAQLSLDDLPSSLNDVPDFAVTEDQPETQVPDIVPEPEVTAGSDIVAADISVSSEEPVAEVPRMTFTSSTLPQLVIPEPQAAAEAGEADVQTRTEEAQDTNDDLQMIEDFNPVLENVREKEEAALHTAQETESEEPVSPFLDIPDDLFSAEPEAQEFVPEEPVVPEGDVLREEPAEPAAEELNVTEEKPEEPTESPEILPEEKQEDIFLDLYTEPEDEDTISLPVEPAAAPVADQVQTEGSDRLFDFDSAVDGLAAAVLRDNAWLYSMNNLSPVGEDLVKIDGLTSKYYVNEVDCSYPSYRDITYDFPAGSVTAVISSVPFCSYAFVRAIACPEEVAQGTVILGDRKLTHNDVLYVGSDRLAEKGRQTLEWLMSTIGGKTEQKRAKLLPILERVGMSNLADIQMESLSYSQRMLVLLIAVSFSNTPVILINDPKFEIEEIDVNSACEVFKLLSDAGKAVLIAGHSPRLLRSVANRVLAIHYGNQMFGGSYRSFIEENCNALVVFHSSDAESAAEKLSQDERFEVSVDRDIVEVMRAEGSTAGEKEAIEAARDAGVPVESLRNGDKGFSIAYKEVFKSRPRV